MKHKKEDLICSKCENEVNYLSLINGMCYHCRMEIRKEKINLYLRELEKELKYKTNTIQMIEGGSGDDNNMSAFNDYLYTIITMRKNLQNRGYKTPFIIISNIEVYEEAGSGNNWQFIATEYNKDIEIKDLWKIEDKEGVIKKVVINERDYILSRNWIIEWNFYNFRDNRLMLTNGQNACITGVLTLK